MSPQIDELPTELLHFILAKLDPRTLRNCRLVKRQWRDIGNEYFLPAIRTATIAQLSLTDFVQKDIIAGHVRSIRFTKKESEEWPDQSNVSEATDPEPRHEIMTWLFKHPFKRLESVTISDGRPFPTMHQQRDWSSEATSVQFENLWPVLSNPSIRLGALHVEWVHTWLFLSKAADVSPILRSLTILRLGILCDRELKGASDLRLILRGLSNLRQLELSTPEDMDLPLYSLIDIGEREVAWPHLASLTLRGFNVGEPLLRRLFSLPSLRSIGIARITLCDDGCWIRLLAALQNKRWGAVHLSGWLANSTTDEGWYGDSDEGGSLFEEVAEWLKCDDRRASSDKDCPLTIDNMNL
jgi:hypothetical protein